MNTSGPSAKLFQCLTCIFHIFRSASPHASTLAMTSSAPASRREGSLGTTSPAAFLKPLCLIPKPQTATAQNMEAGAFHWQEAGSILRLTCVRSDVWRLQVLGSSFKPFREAPRHGVLEPRGLRSLEAVKPTQSSSWSASMPHESSVDGSHFSV